MFQRVFCHRRELSLYLLLRPKIVCPTENCCSGDAALRPSPWVAWDSLFNRTDGVCLLIQSQNHLLCSPSLDQSSCRLQARAARWHSFSSMHLVPELLGIWAISSGGVAWFFISCVSSCFYPERVVWDKFDLGLGKAGLLWVLFEVLDSSCACGQPP